jgi:hypothetical protein
MKIRRVGNEFPLTGGQTDMTTLTVAFRNFARAPKTEEVITKIQICFVALGHVDRKSAAFHLITPDTTAGSSTDSCPQNIVGALTLLPQAEFPIAQFNRLTILILRILMPITFASNKCFGLIDNPVESGKE